MRHPIAVSILASAIIAVSSTPTPSHAAAAPAQIPAPTAPAAMGNRDWWPQTLDLSALRQHETQSNPYGADYDYAKEFASLDLDAVRPTSARP